MNKTLIDTHCHLYTYPVVEREGVVERARESRVSAIVVPGVEEESSLEAIEFAKKYKGFVFAAVGIHPQVVRQEDADCLWLSKMALNPDVIAIGEIGLDSEVKEPAMSVQEERFLKQLDIAKRTDRPVLVHCRGAIGKTIHILEEWGGKGGILHAWPGTKDATGKLLDRGFYCGACGVVTRASAHRKRENIRSIPLEKIVLETDSPYIGTEKSPKGKVEPANLVEICKALSLLYGVSEEVVAEITTKNALTVLGLE